MKTITLTDEQHEFIMNLVQEMSTQDNRATQFPMFVVSEMVERAVPDGCGESKRKTHEYCTGLCEKCEKLYDNDEDLPEYCSDCDQDCFYDSETKRETIDDAGAFFTAKACDEHIAKNHYHYHDGKSYGISCWRNPEMVKIFEILFAMAGKELPSHYK